MPSVLPLIRVAHVVNSLRPGGMENGIVNVANKLPPDEFEVHVCCIEQSGAFADRLPDSRRVHVLGKKSGFSVQTVRALAQKLDELAPAVVHTHNLGPLIYASLAKVSARHPILHGEHSQLTAEDLQPKRLLQRKLLYALCHQIHTVSEGQRTELLRHGFGTDHILSIVNGVDTARFRPESASEARAKLGIPDGFWIGIMGRFGPHKGHIPLLDAFEAIAAEFQDLRLMIVGVGGPMEALVHERIKGSRFAERIWFPGYQKDTSPFYRALNLLVVPSTNEGLSNVVLESMASGVPVLAHLACGNDEAIIAERDGFLRELDTSESIASALRELAMNPGHLVAMGAQARKRVERDFSLEHMTRQYAALYRRLASGTA